MKVLAKLFLIHLLLAFLVHSQVTFKRNALLSRQRRYLLFPKGANFVITYIMVKALLLARFRGTNTLLECDIPFALPYETRLLQKYRKRLREKMQRRDILHQIESSINDVGSNGNACLQQLICEANKYVKKNNSTFIGDLVSTVFHDLESENVGVFGPKEYHDYPYDCSDDCRLAEHCPFPIYELYTSVNL